MLSPSRAAIYPPPMSFAWPAQNALYHPAAGGTHMHAPQISIGGAHPHAYKLASKLHPCAPTSKLLSRTSSIPTPKPPQRVNLEAGIKVKKYQAHDQVSLVQIPDSTRLCTYKSLCCAKGKKTSNRKAQ